jgi:phosphate transport system protein
MVRRVIDIETIDHHVARLFALVTDGLAGATSALLEGDTERARRIIDRDESIDSLTIEIDNLIWSTIDTGETSAADLHNLVGILLIVPELERSADLAEHIAQRALTHLGAEMSPRSRGIAQSMSDIALDMWRTAADAYLDKSAQGVALDEADEALDQLRDRLIEEVATGEMALGVGGQVTLLARFYERLGDHAVNLARRIERLHVRPAGQ